MGSSEPDLGAAEEALRYMETVLEILKEEESLTAEMLNRLQPNPPSDPSFPVNDWKQGGRIFGVTCGGKEYFPRYQFDASYQPLPLIREVLEAWGTVTDTWKIIAWFHYPNGQIVKTGPEGVRTVAPKDALDCRKAVLHAVEKRTGSYFA